MATPYSHPLAWNDSDKDRCGAAYAGAKGATHTSGEAYADTPCGSVIPPPGPDLPCRPLVPPEEVRSDDAEGGLTAQTITHLHIADLR